MSTGTVPGAPRTSEGGTPAGEAYGAPGTARTGTTRPGAPATARRARRRGAVAATAFVAGLGLAASIPPAGIWPLAFPAAALLVWRLGGLRTRARALAGFLAGLGLFIPGLFWATSFNVAGGVVLIVAESCFFAVAAMVVAPGPGRAVSFPAAFTLVTAARGSWPFGGLPLGGVALGQAAGPLAFSARLGGPLVVAAIVWTGGVALAWAWEAGGGSRRLQLLVRRGPGGAPAPQRKLRVPPARGAGRAITAMVAGALVAAAAAAGALAPAGGPAVHRLRVAAVQGGGPRGLRAVNVDPSVAFDAQLAATQPLLALPARRRPALVVWPEDVIALGGPLAGSTEELQMAQLARSLHATVVAGVTEPVGITRFRNEVVAWAPNGRITSTYEKVHRVPFGEYVPFRSFFAHFANLSDVPRDAIPGKGPGLMRTPAGPLGAMVSYEVFFADRGRSATRAGATLLIVPTNTSSYTTAQVPTQEIAAARLQAISEGRDLVQASPTGLSALVDHNGRVIARSGLGNRQLVIGSVAERRGATPYERWGETPIELLAAAALVAGWLAAAYRRRAGSGKDLPAGDRRLGESHVPGS